MFLACKQSTKRGLARLHIFDTLKVIRKVLRTCTYQPQTHAAGETGAKQRAARDEDRRKGSNPSHAFPTVPLARLLLRGNNVSDTGALALARLVKESPHLKTIDLRDNAIGAKGKLALQKVT